MERQRKLIIKDNTSLCQEIYGQNEDEDQEEDELEKLPRNWRFVKHYSQNQILGDLSQGVRT